MLDFNPQSYSPDGSAIFAKDEQLLVKFYKHPELALYASKEAGHPVYHDVVMISVIQPGEKEKIDVLATDMHKLRFPKQWENFERGLDAALTGTPLDHLFPSEPSTIANLKSFNIFTVQQLATISDSAIANIPMGRALTDRAKKYLNTSTAVLAENQDMRGEIEELKAQLAALQAPKEPEKPRRGPGRPPKPPAEGAAQ